jgi:hypothetical protein
MRDVTKLPSDNAKELEMKSKLTVIAPFLAVFAASGGAYAQASCDQIDQAISSTEDFVELALADDRAASKDALGAIGAALADVGGDMPPDAKQGAEALTKQVEGAYAAGDMSAASLAAMDLYGALAAAFERRLPTELNIAMLDESGFRLHALLGAGQTDWAALDSAAKTAGLRWEKSKTSVKDKALVDLMDHLLAGVGDGAANKNPAWLRSSASLLLDSVDLLEHAVKNGAKGACQ